MVSLRRATRANVCLSAEGVVVCSLAPFKTEAHVVGKGNYDILVSFNSTPDLLPGFVSKHHCIHR